MQTAEQVLKSIAISFIGRHRDDLITGRCAEKTTAQLLTIHNYLELDDNNRFRLSEKTRAIRSIGEE